MLGWRARLGLVFPSRGDTFIYEFYRMVPDGVVLVPTIPNTVQQLNSDHFERALENYRRAVEELIYERADAIALTGTPVLSLHGPESHKSLIDETVERARVPATTDLIAAVKACERLGVSQIAVASPYDETLRERERRSLEHYGISVLHIEGTGIQRNIDLTTQPVRASYRVALDAFKKAPKRPEAVFLTCPRWPTAMNIAPLEQDLGVPVFSTSSSTTWDLLSMAGVRQAQPGHGRLFELLQ